MEVRQMLTVSRIVKRVADLLSHSAQVNLMMRHNPEISYSPTRLIWRTVLRDLRQLDYPS